MVFKGLIAATAAIALSATPAIAAANGRAAPGRTAELAPAVESVEGSELRGGFIVPLVAIIAVILGILAITGGDDDGAPVTP